ncbi:MAG: hypothetical protein HY883_04530 [Deltaproteobacteria bacterium]|nr:hypothetical protein [Deltaproteobacteria bacterium]
MLGISVLFFALFSVSGVRAVERAEIIARLQRDVLVKTSLARILGRARSYGLSDEMAVKTVIHAGAEPQTALYLAITGGYSLEGVVRGAVESGVEIRAIVKTALDAGADPLHLARSITALGAQPAEVADMLSKETTAMKILP